VQTGALRIASTRVGRALQQTFARFGGDGAPLRELLAGVAMDLDPAPFADLPALERYCHRVAAAPGLACLPVLGVRSSAAERYAERLGCALQLTNILRDLRSDANAGRGHAPVGWRREHGVAAEWLRGDGPAAAYAVGGPVARLCSALAAAARDRFAAAGAALLELPPADRRRLLPARIMGAVYRELLRRLEARGGELRKERVRVPRGRKLWLAAGTLLGVSG